MDNNYDIIFLGLAKNIKKTVDNFFRSVEKISKKTKILVIIGENSSKDGTRDMLLNYKNPHFKFIYLKTDQLISINNRILRLTDGRQTLKEYILKNKISSNFVTIIDLDDVISKGFSDSEYFKMLKILNNNRDSLFGVSSKSKPYYYDLLPLIIKDYFEFDIYRVQTDFKLFSAFRDRKKYIYDFQRRITKMKDVLTISSHNGLTTYLFDDYMLGNYISSNVDQIVSEHITFNKSIHKITNKKILMSNELNLVTPKEHMPLNFKQFLKNSILKLLRKF